jgi:neprilysin
MKYGSIGHVIGHEIIHGFDNSGIEFNSEGAREDWWLPTTRKVFVKKTQCIVKQYGNFVEPLTNLKVNGELTLPDNIADNGGINIAYGAYKNWVKKHEVEDSLPGLDFTPHQLFWLSSAQNWCSVYTKEQMKQRLEGEHSPNRFRVIGSFQNSKEFSADFKCPVGSPMNPIKKCKIW